MSVISILFFCLLQYCICPSVLKSQSKNDFIYIADKIADKTKQANGKVNAFGQEYPMF